MTDDKQHDNHDHAPGSCEGLGKLAAKVNNQEGRWWLVGAVIGVALVALFTLQTIFNSYNKEAISAIRSSSENTAESTRRMDVTVSAYIAANTERLNQIAARLERLEDEIQDHRTRTDR